MLKNKLLFEGLVIIPAIAYPGYTGFKSSSAYCYTVSEAVPPESSLRINRKAVPGTVHAETGNLTLRSSITEGGNNIPVLYHRVTPDTFQPDRDVVIEGQLDPQGVFQAGGILTKCPSKYALQH